MPAQYTGVLAVLIDWKDLAGAVASTLAAGVAIWVSVKALKASRDQLEPGRNQLELVRRRGDDVAQLFSSRYSALTERAAARRGRHETPRSCTANSAR